MRMTSRYAAIAMAALLSSAAFTTAHAAGSGSTGAVGGSTAPPAVNPSTGLQNNPVGAQNSGTSGITPAPGAASSTTTGMGTGSSATPNTSLYPGNTNQPGVPNTSTPGSIGTGASPSGLPGDDPAHPGFPGKVGH